MSALSEHKHVLSIAVESDPPLYTAPPRVAAAAAACLDLARRELPVPEVTDREVIEAKAIALAAKPTELAKVDVSGAEAARLADRTWQDRRVVLDRAKAFAADELHTAMSACAAELSAAIGAAGAELWTEVEELRRTLDGVDTTSERARSMAGADAQAAWWRLDDLARTDRALRAAHGSIQWPDETAEWDLTAGKGLGFDHGTYRAGWCSILGVGWAKSDDRPWPEDSPPGRLLWLAQHAGPAWFPSPTERDQAWQQTHPEAFTGKREQDRRHWQAHAGLAG